MKIVFHSFSLLATLLLFNPGSAIAVPDRSDSKVCVIVPLTGAFARYGSRIRKGIETSDIPAENLLWEDESCLPAKAVSAFKKLSSQSGIRFFLGPFCGSPQIAIAPLLKTSESLAILGCSAPEAVYKSSGKRMFSTQYSIEQESRFNANQIYQLGVRRIVVLLFESQFSRIHEKAFKESFQGEVLGTFVQQSEDLTEIKNMALQVRKLKPDALYVPDAYPLLMGLLKELHLQGMGHLTVFSVYSAQSSDVLEVAGDQGKRIVYSYPDIGEKDALQYFPSLAAQILSDAQNACGTDIDCAIAHITKDNTFDSSGVMSGKIALRTIEDGEFVSFNDTKQKLWKEKNL